MEEAETLGFQQSVNRKDLEKICKEWTKNSQDVYKPGNHLRELSYLVLAHKGSSAKYKVMYFYYSDTSFYEN